MNLVFEKRSYVLSGGTGHSLSIESVFKMGGKKKSIVGEYSPINTLKQTHFINISHYEPAASHQRHGEESNGRTMKFCCTRVHG
jgi:hypothetical protein